MFKYAMAACAMMLCAGSAQAATTIDFSPIASKVAVPIRYEESGFTLQSNNVIVANNRESNGTLRITNSLGGAGAIKAAAQFLNNTSFTITGGLFTFDAMSIYFYGAGNLATNNVMVSGLRNGRELYSATYEFGDGVKEENGYFLRYTTGSNALLDQLVITSGSAGSSLYVDNITLTSIPAVPEPATWAMMLVGFGAIGAAMRRRRQGGAVRFA